MLRADAVDLVHKDDAWNAQPPERPHQHAGLRLYSLDGGDDGALYGDAALLFER